MDRAALLALHFQNDVVAVDGRVALGLAARPDVREQCLTAALQLVNGARAAALPLIWVRIAFQPGHADLIPNGALFRAVADAGALVEGSAGAAAAPGFEPLPEESVITHRRVNAFHETGLAALLESLGVSTLVLAGVATNSTVEHSARHAADLGYDVLVAEDACASGRPDLHEAALENIRLIGRTATASTILHHWSLAS